MDTTDFDFALNRKILQIKTFEKFKVQCFQMSVCDFMN